MQFLTLALDCYFAAVLGIAGLAKMDDPAPFAATLRRQRLLPAWSVGTIRCLFPWFEIALAAALLSGITAIRVATFTVLIFAGFLIVQILLLATRQGGDCGCYGAASTHRVEAASVATASLLLFLAALHLWLVIVAPTIAWQSRLTAVVLCVVAGSLLGWRTWQRRSARCLQLPAQIRPRRDRRPTGGEALREQTAASEHAEERVQRNPA